MMWLLLFIFLLPAIIRRQRTNIYTKKAMELFSKLEQNYSVKIKFEENNKNIFLDLISLRKKYSKKFKVFGRAYVDDRDALHMYVDELIKNQGKIKNKKIVCKMINTHKAVKIIAKHYRFKPFQKIKLLRAFERLEIGENVEVTKLVKPLISVPKKLRVVKLSKNNSITFKKTSDIFYQYFITRVFVRARRIKKIDAKI